MRSAWPLVTLALAACGDHGIVVADLKGLTAAGADARAFDAVSSVTDAPIPSCDIAFAVLCVTFDSVPLGSYSRDQAMSDFQTQLDWDNGLHAGDSRAQITEGSGSGRYLQIVFPKGRVGPDGGAQFFAPLPATYDDLYLAFRIRFGAGFDFVRGGILPGLSGGVAPTGSSPRPNGSNGWSARMYWREAGTALEQLYYPDETTSFGDTFGYGPMGAFRQFVPEVWHTVEHRIRMNTVGQKDGLAQAWFDGEPFEFPSPLRFRDVPALGIDHLFFSAFFGGDTPDWAASKDETMDLDDIVISTHPISH